MTMRMFGTISLLMICLALSARAQTDTASQSQSTSSYWLAYMANISIASDASIWFDTHYNHRAFYVLRVGLTKHFGVGTSLTAGYAQLWLDPGSGTLERKEYRPWAQVVFPFRLNDDWTFSQRIRYDMRFQENVENGQVTNGTTMTNRVRFQSVFTRYFGQADFGQLFVQAANETLVNFGSTVGPNWLDQNRLSLLGGLRLETVTLRVGYMYRFIPGASGLFPTHESSIVFWFNHTIPLSESDEETLPEVLNP